jgi:hypothetical protein
VIGLSYTSTRNFESHSHAKCQNYSSNNFETSNAAANLAYAEFMQDPKYYFTVIRFQFFIRPTHINQIPFPIQAAIKTNVREVNKESQHLKNPPDQGQAQWRQVKSD